jgi:predicted amidohydrolase
VCADAEREAVVQLLDAAQDAERDPGEDGGEHRGAGGDPEADERDALAAVQRQRDAPHAAGAALAVAAAQPLITARDLPANAAAHAAAIRAADARLVVFPELSLTGYELTAAPVSADDDALAAIVAACAETGAVALAGAPVREPDGREYIAMLRFDATGATVVYRKRHLGGDETARFIPGEGAAVLELDGRRIGLGICKDTGVADHVRAMAALRIDAYVAGLVHRPEELAVQDRRGASIARTCSADVVFASFAGPTGGGFDRTAGTSTIWAPTGATIARAGAEPGELARAHIAH